MIGQMRSTGFWKDFDWLLLAAPILLSVISLVHIYSSTLNFGSDGFVLRQLAWVIVGIVFLFVVASFDYRAISEQIPWLYLGGILVLLYTLALGKTVSGAQSWISFGPVGFQPSEMFKLVVIVALARYLAELRSSRFMSLAQIFKAGVICGVPMLLIILQPDLGTTLTYGPIFAVGIFVRGVKPRVLVILGLAFIMALPLAWMFLKDYQKDRIMTFVNPESDPLGAGYQVMQSKIAVGSGGLTGKGLFQGSQNQLGFLPTRHTDFIMSVVGEEFGFVGVSLTLGLLAFVLFRCIYNAQTAGDLQGLFIAMGVTGLFFFQIVVNAGMVIGFVPVTGIPMPFLSYGGSSVLTAYMALGLVASVRRRRYVN